MDQLISDHSAICFNLKLEKPAIQRKIISSRRLKNFDLELFNRQVIESGLLDENNCLWSTIEKYDASLLAILDKQAPIKIRTTTVHANAPWYTSEVADAKRKRRRLERKWRVT